MEPVASNEPRKIQAYAIPAESFVPGGSNVTEPTEYNFNQRVTRDNFTNFLISIFARSRGNTVILWAPCEWLKRKQGFDYVRTFTNFLENGAESSFSPTERDRFMEYYRRISAHEEFNPEKFKITFSNLIDGGDKGSYLYDRQFYKIPDSVFDQSQTMEELYKALEAYR